MQGFKSETRTISEIEVTVTEIDCFAQQDLWVALTQEAAPGIGGLGQLLSGGLEGLINSQEDLSSVVPLLVEALKGLSGKKLMALQLQTFVSSQAQVEGKLIPLRTKEGCLAAFGPNMDVMYTAWLFAIEVIFTRFFARLRSWMSAAKAMIEVKAAEAATRKASVSILAPS